MALDSARVKELAFEVGFDLCGIAAAEPPAEALSRLKSWLERGFHGRMDYMAKDPERRADPLRHVASAASVIVLGLNYFQKNSVETPPDHGRVARYARGRDYHKVIERLIGKLIDSMESECDQESAVFKGYVDSGPILERAFAQRAGLGYIGRNSMLINRTFGSWVFLSAIVTDLRLEPDDPNLVKHGTCGSCRRCIDACPTGAIVEGRVIDATRCISYLTIERPSAIPQNLAERVGELIFGCDICQEVCPHNQKRSKMTRHKELLDSNGVGEFLDAQRVLSLQSRESFLELTAGTPLTRPKLEGLQQNARIVLENEANNRHIRTPAQIRRSTSPDKS